MNQKIRIAIPEDAEHFVRIKKCLPLNMQHDHTKQGGFLLGTSLETYKFYIAHGFCLTATASDQIVGFGIQLPDHLIKQSELWEKRKTAKWTMNLATLENSTIAYIEQLAFLKGYHKLVLALSYNLIHDAFKKGAQYVLTTTVRKPVVNEAAIPLVQAVGGSHIGNIDEVYPEVGEINSDIYAMEKSLFYQRLRQRISYDFMAEHSLSNAHSESK